MESMDFEEFLWARGYQADFIEDMLGRIVARKPLGPVETTALSRLFLDYCVLGGMPAVVSRHFENGTFEGVLGVQRDIVADYKDDMRKYAEGVDQTRLLNVFNRIPVQLAAENKKFQISKVSKDARFKDYRGCIDWICDAGIARRCHCLSFPASPLRGNFDPDRFKLYLADTGLLVSLLDDETQQDVRTNRNLGGYKGGLFENIVGEALAKQGYDLFYYKREDSTLEEDFFVRAGDDVVPVEVKSTQGRSKSLRTLIASDHYPDIRWGVKFTAGNVGFENRILTIPYYTAFLLRRILERGTPST